FSTRWQRRSPECEHEHLYPWIKKLDLELSISDRLGLSNQLIHALFADAADATFVDVDSVGGTRLLSIDEDSKPHRSPLDRRSHHQMQIACVEAIPDPPIGVVEYGRLLSDRPDAVQRPIIEA